MLGGLVVSIADELSSDSGGGSHAAGAAGGRPTRLASG